MKISKTVISTGKNHKVLNEIKYHLPQASTAYYFGSDGGLVGVNLAGTTTTTDTVVFGIVTQQADASVIYISSSNTHDFLEFKLVGWFYFMRVLNFCKFFFHNFSLTLVF